MGVGQAIFNPQNWLQDIENRGDKRWGFEGYEVDDIDILNTYKNKEVPKAKGMSNPIRYFESMQILNNQHHELLPRTQKVPFTS